MLSLIVFSLMQTQSWERLDTDLKSWDKKGGASTYRSVNGEIIGTTAPNTENAFLCTKKTYGDFELEFEVKVHSELNSGVQIRSHSVLGYQNGRVHGYQVEIDTTTRGFSGGIYDEARRGWLQDLSKNEAGRKAFKNNAWNKYRILAIGENIQVWVNGIKSSEINDDVDKFGFIGLQVHSVGDRKDALEVRWRNMRIRDFGIPGATPPKGAETFMSNADDASKWENLKTPGQPIGWNWKSDSFETEPRSGSIMTKKAFGDCKAHVEFSVDENGKEGQENGNSGVYLQGRYEVQVLNSAGQPPALDNCGAIYSIKAPDYNMALPAGEWQSYDIDFTAARWGKGKKIANARMTVYHNGTLIHKNVEVPSHTTAGRTEEQGDGGIYLQDHGNRIRYRNIWILPS